MSAATSKLPPAGWTAEQFETLCSLWDRGEKLVVIAAVLGMTEGRVAGVIERNRARFPNRKPHARARRRGRYLAALWLKRRDEIIAGCAA